MCFSMPHTPGVNMARRIELDEFHWHEALDRSLLAFEFFDERVRQHPAIEQTKELQREAQAISDRMFQLYQSLGARHLARRPGAAGGE